MAIDVSKMSVSELDKLSAKIEKRRQELTQHEALTQMKAVAKKHGVDFSEIVRLHNTKLAKPKPKVTRKAAAKTIVKTAPTVTTKAATKVAPKATASVKGNTVKKTADSPVVKTKLSPRVKYKNPDNPKQTWSGMGRRPAWLIAHLEAGRKLEGLAA